MLRHEKVADRAGALVTQRVRGLIEAAEERAQVTRRNADEEASRLDNQRMQAASRIVTQIDELEGALGRLRQQMQSEHAEGGSYVDEARQIAAADEEAESAPAAAEPADTAPPEADVVHGAESETTENEDEGSQGTRFSFLRRKERQEEASDGSPEGGQESTAEEDLPENSYSCAVCGRGFVGDEAELKALGWVVAESGEVTCADCHSAGWLRPSE
jgi:hypothetical protein